MDTIAPLYLCVAALFLLIASAYMLWAMISDIRRFKRTKKMEG